MTDNQSRRQAARELYLRGLEHNGCNIPGEPRPLVGPWCGYSASHYASIAGFGTLSSYSIGGAVFSGRVRVRCTIDREARPKKSRQKNRLQFCLFNIRV